MEGMEGMEGLFIIVVGMKSEKRKKKKICRSGFYTEFFGPLHPPYLHDPPYLLTFHRPAIYTPSI